MVISNCLFSPASENPRVPMAIGKRNYSEMRPLGAIKFKLI